MINYTKYFDECQLPPVGIDKISFTISRYLIEDFTVFHKRGNINEPLNFRFKEKNGHGYDYCIDIHAEIINPDLDIFEQIITYITEFSDMGILRKPQHHTKDEIKMYVRTWIENILFLNCIEFYFDFKPGDIQLANILALFKTTRYSQDYPGERKSVLKAYDRTARLMKKRNIPHEKIKNMWYTNRIEFNLNRRNCKYLSLKNLHGNYDYVFSRYLPFLARKWSMYGAQVANIPNWPGYDYYYFRQVIGASQGRINRPRLQKTPPIPKPSNLCTSKDVDLEWIMRFSKNNW